MLRPQQAGAAAARLARLRLLQQQQQQHQSHELLVSSSARAGRGRATFSTAGRDGGEPPASGGILSNMLKRCVSSWLSWGVLRRASETESGRGVLRRGRRRRAIEGRSIPMSSDAPPPPPKHLPYRDLNPFHTRIHSFRGGKERSSNTSSSSGKASGGSSNNSYSYSGRCRCSSVIDAIEAIAAGTEARAAL